MKDQIKTHQDQSNEIGKPSPFSQDHRPKFTGSSHIPLESLSPALRRATELSMHILSRDDLASKPEPLKDYTVRKGEALTNTTVKEIAAFLSKGGPSVEASKLQGQDLIERATNIQQSLQKGDMHLINGPDGKIRDLVVNLKAGAYPWDQGNQEAGSSNQGDHHFSGFEYNNGWDSEGDSSSAPSSSRSSVFDFNPFAENPEPEIISSRRLGRRTEYIYYRANRTRAREEIYRADNSLEYETYYRADETRERRVYHGTDGTSIETYYRENGRTPERRVHYDADRTRVSEDFYRVDGNINALERRVYYREDGETPASQEFYTNEIRARQEFYRADGRTIAHEEFYDRDYGQTIVHEVQYRADD